MTARPPRRTKWAQSGTAKKRSLTCSRSFSAASPHLPEPPAPPPTPLALGGALKSSPDVIGGAVSCVLRSKTRETEGETEGRGSEGRETPGSGESG